MRLVILADDFTGALDTGVQFAQEGISTGFYSDIGAMKEALRDGSQEVLVMNTNTRHLPPDAGYQRIYEYGKEISGERPDMILKKTDSGLRGHIGKELAAVMDAAGETMLHFIPSYPGMKRITKQGIHYIDGVPVAESVFGRDPFDAVPISEVGILIQEAAKPICHASVQSAGDRDIRSDGIYVWDAETDHDIYDIITRVMQEPNCRKPGIRLWAGCAGLARALAHCLPFQRKQQQTAAGADRLLIVCGSVNDVTRKQAEFAQSHDFIRGSAEIGVLQQQDGRESERKRLLDLVMSSYKAGKSCILDTGFPDIKSIERYSLSAGCTVTELGERISGFLGELAVYLYEQAEDACLMIIGGDTLQGLMDRLTYDHLEMIGEIRPGVIMIRLRSKGRERLLLTKSGGFGEEEILTQLS